MHGDCTLAIGKRWVSYREECVLSFKPFVAWFPTCNSTHDVKAYDEYLNVKVMKKVDVYLCQNTETVTCCNEA